MESKDNKKVSEVSDKVMYLTVRDYTNYPFVIKKVESAKKILEKYGLPKELING
jgi:hypothetical protein